MSNNRDMLFKLGLTLQLLLIPVVFLWRFSQEANYYNIIITVSFLVVIALFFWPQATVVRVKRLKAIKVQSVLVVALLVISWGLYAYFHNYLYGSNSGIPAASYGNDVGWYEPAHMRIYSVNWEGIFGSRWVMLLNPGISVLTAAGMTVAFLALSLSNLYRYRLDKKRIHGIKKEELFV